VGHEFCVGADGGRVSVVGGWAAVRRRLVTENRVAWRGPQSGRGFRVTIRAGARPEEKHGEGDGPDPQHEPVRD